MSTTTPVGDRKRAEIYEFIVDYWSVHHIAPTIREIARGVNVHPSTAHHHTHILERAGLLESTPGAMRSLRVVERP